MVATTVVGTSSTGSSITLCKMVNLREFGRLVVWSPKTHFFNVTIDDWVFISSNQFLCVYTIEGKFSTNRLFPKSTFVCTTDLSMQFVYAGY